MITFNQSKERSLDFEGEAVRLSNEFRKHPSKTYIDENGKATTIPEKTHGFDPESVSLNTLRNYRGQSQAQKDFLTILIKMRSGKIAENINLLGETGYNKKHRKNLKDSMLN